MILTQIETHWTQPQLKWLINSPQLRVRRNEKHPHVFKNDNQGRKYKTNAQGVTANADAAKSNRCKNSTNSQPLVGCLLPQNNTSFNDLSGQPLNRASRRTGDFRKESELYSMIARVPMPPGWPMAPYPNKCISQADWFRDGCASYWDKKYEEAQAFAEFKSRVIDRLNTLLDNDVAQQNALREFFSALSTKGDVIKYSRLLRRAYSEICTWGEKYPPISWESGPSGYFREEIFARLTDFVGANNVAVLHQLRPFFDDYPLSGEKSHEVYFFEKAVEHWQQLESPAHVLAFKVDLWLTHLTEYCTAVWSTVSPVLSAALNLIVTISAWTIFTFLFLFIWWLCYVWSGMPKK